MRQELVDELKECAGLTDERHRRAAEVFEDFLRDRAGGQKQFQGLSTGAFKFFEDRD